MENQQNESNTLIAWVIGAAVTVAIAIAFIFTAVAINASGDKTAAAPATPQASEPAKADAAATPADTNAPAQGDASQPKSN